MELRHRRNFIDNERCYELIIPDDELMCAKLDRFDLALTRDVEDDPHSSIADKLLVLERIVFRIEQALGKGGDAIPPSD